VELLAASAAVVAVELPHRQFLVTQQAITDRTAEMAGLPGPMVQPLPHPLQTRRRALAGMRAAAAAAVVLRLLPAQTVAEGPTAEPDSTAISPSNGLNEMQKFPQGEPNGGARSETKGVLTFCLRLSRTGRALHQDFVGAT
jgi:hypothetical protein